MLQHYSLEESFKILHQDLDKELLYQLLKQGKKHKNYMDLVYYFKKEYKEERITLDTIDAFTTLYRLSTDTLYLHPKKIAKQVTKLFLYYLKNIKLPDMQLGVPMGEFYIAGTNYISDISEVMQKLQINERVKIISEKKNPYDKNAVKIISETDVKLGYLPKRFNNFPAYMLEYKVELFGIIKKLQWDVNSYNIKVILYIKQ